MTSLFRLARKSLLLWFGAAFLAVGLVFLDMGIDGLREEQRYQNEGRRVQAVVATKSIRPASRDGNSSTKYETTYRFAAVDGRTVEGTDTVSVETWEGLQAGSRLDVTYLPARPHASRATSASNMESALAAIGLGGLFALIGGFFFLTNAVKIWRRWRILRTGTPAEGTVLAIEPTNTQINRTRQWEVRHQYRDPAGRIHEGTSGNLAPDEAHAYAIGGAVKLRFSREHPEESAWAESAATAATLEDTQASRPDNGPPLWKRALRWVGMLAAVFVVLVIGEVVVPITGIDDFISRHESVLQPTTIGMTALGFALFMGGIPYRIFSGAGEPMSHADVEDHLRSTRVTRGQPYFARASTYRFKGRSMGSSFSDEFSIKEAKQAWHERAWRESPRWRGNFIVMTGALLLAVGLFSIFVVVGTNGVKLLCGGALLYAMARTVIAFARA